MSIYKNLTIAEWQHKFAGEFFDLFVEYELKSFGKRIILEANLYEIAYNNAVAASDEWKQIDPVESAKIKFLELKIG
jgi:hypothetical protein